MVVAFMENLLDMSRIHRLIRKDDSVRIVSTLPGGRLKPLAEKTAVAVISLSNRRTLRHITK
jgi:hypothetical protein